MVLNEVKIKDILRRRQEINDFLITPFIPRIKKWIRKADKTTDAFDKFLALFISMNMFYNLLVKIKYPNKNYETFGDGKKFYATLDLVDYSALPFTLEDVSSLIQILRDERLVVNLKRKENNQWIYELAQDKLEENINNNEKLAEYMWKTIYKIRCNLIHGEKSYENRQIRLLNQTSLILKKIIEELIIRLNNLIEGEQR